MKQHTPGVGHSIPHRVGGRRGRGPRDDLAFCLPISVSLAHSDWAGFVACSLHLFTLVIVLQALEGVPCLTTAIAVVISLLVCLRQQRRICGFNFLDCDQSGQWSLVDASGRHQWVRLDGLSVAGPYCLVRLRRFGSHVFWITCEQYQSGQNWRRLRVLSRLL